MQVVIVSHKEIWTDDSSASGYATVGGFPFQIQLLSELFDQTTLLVLLRSTPLPPGAMPLAGHNLSVEPLPEPGGQELRRKIALLAWLPRHLPQMWRAACKADAVHALVPGDIGTLGILVALAQRKPLFVRHCGTWGEPVTLADHFLLWLLERIAGGRNVVMATGGGDHPPSLKNPHIQWIFSTTLTEAELASLPQAQPWQPGEPLRLVTVGRLSPQKNIAAILQAIPAIQGTYAQVHLDVLGDGEALAALQRLAQQLHIADWVTFHGNVSHGRVLQLLSQSHLFLFPTRVKEGFPKAVLEAMACGLPVIATRVSVISHLLKDGAGLLLPDPSAEAIAQATLNLLQNPDHLMEMGKKARKVALGYSLEAWRDTIGARLQATWESLQGSKASFAFRASEPK